MLPAGLSDFFHVVMDLSIAVDPTTLDPELFDQPRLPNVSACTTTKGLPAPGVETAPVYSDHSAERAHHVLVTVRLDERVLHPDCLAKYAAAFLEYLALR